MGPDKIESLTDVCDVVALGHVRVPLADIPAMRRERPTVADGVGAALALRHADEHTLVGIKAMRQAIDGAQLDSLSDWGVLVSSRYPGRMGFAQTIHRINTLGPQSVSPMTAATLCLHSAAGTLSLVMGLHGPSFGVSGSPTHVSEGLVAALALRGDKLAPGIFLVLTDSDPELLPDRQGKVATQGSIHGVALGLSTTVAAAPLFRLRMQRSQDLDAAYEPTRLLDLVSFLAGENQRQPIPLVGGGCIDIERVQRPSLARAA